MLLSDATGFLKGLDWEGWCDGAYVTMYHFTQDPILNIGFVDGHVKLQAIAAEVGIGVYYGTDYTWDVP